MNGRSLGSVALVLVLSAGCGFHIGTSSARRVFPNPPTASSLERAPLISAVDASPVSCPLSLAETFYLGVEITASAPWGMAFSRTGQGTLPREPGIEQAVGQLVDDAVRACSGVSADASVASAGAKLRILVERIEVNAFHDESPGMDTARVIVRAELITSPAGVLSVRGVGTLRAAPSTLTAADLVTSAARAALRDLWSELGAARDKAAGGRS